MASSAKMFLRMEARKVQVASAGSEVVRAIWQNVKFLLVTNLLVSESDGFAIWSSKPRKSFLIVRFVLYDRVCKCNKQIHDA
jgi:hypothetical protein